MLSMHASDILQWLLIFSMKLVLLFSLHTLVHITVRWSTPSVYYEQTCIHYCSPEPVFYLLRSVSVTRGKKISGQSDISEFSYFVWPVLKTHQKNTQHSHIVCVCVCACACALDWVGSRVFASTALVVQMAVYLTSYDDYQTSFHASLSLPNTNTHGLNNIWQITNTHSHTHTHTHTHRVTLTATETGHMHTQTALNPLLDCLSLSLSLSLSLPPPPPPPHPGLQWISRLNWQIFPTKNSPPSPPPHSYPPPSPCRWALHHPSTSRSCPGPSYGAEVIGSGHCGLALKRRHSSTQFLLSPLPLTPYPAPDVPCLFPPPPPPADSTLACFMLAWQQPFWLHVFPSIWLLSRALGCRLLCGLDAVAPLCPGLEGWGDGTCWSLWARSPPPGAAVFTFMHAVFEAVDLRT